MVLHDRLVCSDTDECINWSGTCHKNGYGIVSLNRKLADTLGLSRVQFAHRMSHLQSNGPIASKVVRHMCDNKSCINPKHLVIGTQKDNADDAVRSGLSKRKLTQEQANFIYGSKDSNRKLAASFGVSPTTIYHIKNGNKWRHHNGSTI